MEGMNAQTSGTARFVPGYPARAMNRAMNRVCAALGLGLLAACSTPVAESDGGTDGGADARIAPVDAWAPDTGVDAGPPTPVHTATAPLVQWVDTMIGTGGAGYNDVGAAHPGPQWPFGMIRPGADSCGADGRASTYLHTAGYHAGETHISGFSHTRMHGTGINDYGIVALMPVIGATTAHTMEDGLIAPMVPGTEHASPGRYEVSLGDAASAIGVELTASARVGFHRITFPASGEPAIFVDLGHAQPGVAIVTASGSLDTSAHEISGTIHFSGGYSDRFGGVTMYFVMRFDQAFVTSGTWESGALHAGETSRDAITGGLYVTFAPGAVVRAAVAVSFVDLAGARANLDAEDRGLDFDAARTAAVAEWERRLGILELEGRSETDFRLAYTALYHSLLMPTLATDVDHRYRGIDQQIGTVTDYTYYTDFSMWDTYRTFHTLITLIDPALENDFVRSMMAMAEALGRYPRWPLGTGETDGMLGDPAAVIVWDSWVRGVRDFDLMHAYEMFVPAADGTIPGRGGVHSYTTLGYVADEEGTAAMTMEYAIADDSIARMAHELGLTADEARFHDRALSYQRTYDAVQGYFVNRRADGTFVTVNPDSWHDSYAEGDARQYLWLAPHDPEGLAETLGGTETALARLRDLFEHSLTERHTPLPPVYYWQGNEPDIHAPYLFSAWGAPDEAALWSRWALRAFYGEGPNGLPGNDDGGTMSAWLIFTELGFYPLAGSDQFLFGSPLFTRATLHLPGGDLVIDAPDAWDPWPFVTGLTLDGTSIPRDRIAHDRLVHGATLHFDQAAEPL
jgi:predicted alpha-1,2-mannosidase